MTHPVDAKVAQATAAASLTARRAEGKLARPLSELLNDPTLLVEPVEAVPLLAVQGGVTLFSGREKTGKTTLVAWVVSQLTAAGARAAVLGVDVETGVTVGWYCVDERLNDAVRRFAGMGADPDRLWLNDTPRTMDDLITAIGFDMAARPETRVVVLDTLSRILAASGVDTNDAGPVEREVGRLVDALHRLGVAAVLVYHTGKAGTTYRGSTALGAVVDDIATLRRRSTSTDSEDGDDFDDAEGVDDGRRLLVQDGRYLRGRVQLVADARSGRYELYDKTLAASSRVLNALTRGPAKSKTQLAQWAGGRRADTLAEITALLSQGAITQHSDGSIALVPAGSHAGAQAGRELVPGTGSASVPTQFPLYGNRWEPVPPVPVSHPPTPAGREPVPHPAEHVRVRV